MNDDTAVPSPAESERLARALEGSRLGLWDWNMQTGETILSERWAEIIGYTLAELEPVSIETWLAHAHPDDLEISRGYIEAHSRGETDFYDAVVRMHHRDGHWVWVHDRGRIVERDAAGRPLRMVGTHEDVTDRVEAERSSIERAQRRDALTGLPNRAALLDDVAQRMADDPSLPVSLLLIDLDRFAAVNDSYGHARGDAILLAVADRLALVDGILYRLGSDEFALISGEVEAEGQGSLASRVLASLVEPVHVPDDGELFLSACIGLAVAMPGDVDAVAVVQKADAALIEAKRHGPGSVRHHVEALADISRRRLGLENRLRRSWAAREFALQYQPKVAVTSGAMVGVEALMRWGPSEGVGEPPSVFIPVAEEIGLIGEMGDWVLREACRQARVWADEGLPEFPIAVNVSARQLTVGDVPAAVVTAVAEFGVPLRQLELEITESTLIEVGSSSVDLLGALRDMGVRLAVDDFGTGYSSFGYVQRFPMNVLKIDRVFISALERSDGDRAICSAIISLGHALGMTVVAESVETKAQLEILREQGCDVYQGLLACPPLDPEDLADFARATSVG